MRFLKGIQITPAVNCWLAILLWVDKYNCPSQLGVQLHLPVYYFQSHAEIDNISTQMRERTTNNQSNFLFLLGIHYRIKVKNRKKTPEL